MTWVAPKSWPSNSSENGTSSSPMKQAARTANACNESSIFMASRVVTGTPSIACTPVRMNNSPFSLMMTPVGPFRVRIGRSPFHGLLQNACLVELVFRPVQHHRIGVDRGRVLRDVEVGGERAVLVIGEVERGFVDLAEALALEDLPQALLAVEVGLRVTLLGGELARPFDEGNKQAERAVAFQDDRPFELGEPLEPAHPHRGRGLAVDVQHQMTGAVVVAVEFLPVRALLLAHEDGGPQRVALEQLVGSRRKLDRYDRTVAHPVGRRLYGHIQTPSVNTPLSFRKRRSPAVTSGRF